MRPVLSSLFLQMTTRLYDIWPMTFWKLLMIVLRTHISAKYCWFGWWLGAWSTPSHHPTQLCDIYISGYKYTLISEWTRLFGLLRILDNLIAGAVCYFRTTFSVFCEIYTLRMRVVAHAAILWVWCFLCRRPELGLHICPHQIVHIFFNDRHDFIIEQIS